MNARTAALLSSCLLTCLPSALAVAAPKKTADAEPRIAVVDLGKVFEEHAAFRLRLADFKAEVTQADERVKRQQGEIQKAAEGLKGLLPGSRDYLDLETDLKKQIEDLKTQVQLQKAEFVQREAEVYHDVYQEVVAEVAAYAAENDLEMVLRIGATTGEVKTAQQILQELNKQVIWYADSRDITQAIVARINKKAGKTGASDEGEKPNDDGKSPSQKEKNP